MKRRICCLLAAGLLGCLAPATALADELAGFELSLFGYHIGMNFDQAAAVRSFSRVEERPGPSEQYCGFIDHYWVDDVETDLRVCFIDEQVFKIVGRVSPALVEDLATRLQETLGNGDDESIMLEVPDGGQVRNRIQKWKFPGMKVVLIGTSRNTTFATLSLVANRRTAAAPDKDSEGDPGAAEEKNN